MELTFKWKEQKVTTYVSVRSGSRQPCLLGTNVVIPLGLMKCDPDLEGQEIEQNSRTTHLVNLVRVANLRIPGYCAAIRKGKVTNSTYLGKHYI